MDILDYKAKPNKTIREHNQDLLNVLDHLFQLGYTDDRTYNLVKAALTYHDYGKANREFQKRVNYQGKKLKFNHDKEVFHNVLSIFLINPEDFSNEQDYCIVLHAVLNHHNYGNAYEEFRTKTEMIDSLLQDFTTYQIKRKTRAQLLKIAEDREAILTKGFLHKCDYCASAECEAEYPNDFLKSALDHLMDNWLSQNSKAKWNDLQRFCIENQDNHIIAVAQTGMGKTEAGLHWIGDKKGYFVLPLRTAINAIYDRVRNELLDNKAIDTRVSILHSDSLEYYSKNLLDEEINLIDYYNRGKQLSIPLSMSTMDQLFDFIFKYQGYELKLTTLSYSKIVIDEIQMYSPDLLAYLVAGLEMIHEMGGKIAILTATLSPFIKDCFKNIPFREQVFVDQSIRHHISVLDKKIDSHDIWEKYKENEQKNTSGKILVVCNTISKAQDIYMELKEISDNFNEGLCIDLLHSRFIREERSDKERRIIEFGKTYAEKGKVDNQLGIWISTSLVEASLDIDFDYLFTELQDLNSLFQRLGRCNRKGVKDTSESNCFVYTQIDTKYLSSANGFIDNTLFSLSKEAVRTISGPLSEEMKILLIDTYLTTENLRGSKYDIDYRDNYNFIKSITPYKFEKNENKLRNILSENIIPSPIYQKYKDKIDEYAQILENSSLDPMEYIMIKENIMQYSVSIPYYQWLKGLLVREKRNIIQQLRWGDMIKFKSWNASMMSWGIGLSNMRIWLDLLI